MRIFIVGPQLGPVRFGASVGAEDFPIPREAPPPNWTVRFWMVFALILPVFSLGLLAERPYLGPGVYGGLYAFLAALGAGAIMGVRLVRYTFPTTGIMLRWFGVFVAALCLVVVATAFYAVTLKL